jgi:aminoglycoside phosphotransferase
MKTEILQMTLPSDVSRFVSEYQPRQIHMGLSNAQVFRLEAENKKTLYLKIAERSFANSLLPEIQRLDWLKNRLPVPEALLFAGDETSDYLLLSEISGAPRKR